MDTQIVEPAHTAQGLVPGSADYLAAWMPDGASIAVSARGVAPAANALPVLRPAPIPSIGLHLAFGYWVEGVGAQVLTPFWIMHRFACPPGIETCTVHDATGAHAVPIRPWPAGWTEMTGSARSAALGRTGYSPESFEGAFLDAMGKFASPGSGTHIVLAQGRTNVPVGRDERREVFFVTVGEL